MLILEVYLICYKQFGKDLIHLPNLIVLKLIKLQKTVFLIYQQYHGQAILKHHIYCKQRRDAIIKRIRKLTTTINANIINTNNFQVYTLLTKFRVMSAISDDNFMQLLINSIDEDHTQALTEAVQGAINTQKAIVNDCYQKV